MTNDIHPAPVEFSADQIEADGHHIAKLEQQSEIARERIAELEAALRLFLKLMDDDDYDFGELCEEFVPIARAALGDKA